MKRFLISLFALLAAGGGLFWYLTIPKTYLDGGDLLRAALEKPGDPVEGEQVFWAGGCASCHAQKGAKGDEKLILGGKHALNTPVGIFHVPNISPDPDHGIGTWTPGEFASAMLYGTSPDGRHYYPAFPYASYASMTYEDIGHLFAFIKTLPAVATQNPDHELAFPFNVSRGIGLWKMAFMSGEPVVQVGAKDEKLLRGRELVEGLGHCGECHTPRTAFGFGGMDRSRWLAGGPAPEGEGRIPNITPHESGIGSWSEGDIVSYLETGFTPEYDSVGGSMVSVQENVAKLPKTDLEAIAAYLKSVPAINSKK